MEREKGLDPSTLLGAADGTDSRLRDKPEFIVLCRGTTRPFGERCVPMRAGWLHKPWRGRQERGTAAVARLSGRAFRTIVVDARPAGLCV